MRQEKGFIFVFTLCITSLIGLLVLSCLQQLMLYQRATVKREAHHQDFYQLERLTRQIIHIPKESLISCMRKQDMANESILNLLNKQACQIKLGKKNYWYLIEDLGIFSCLMIAKDEALKSSHHFRYTVLAPATTEHSAFLIQIRVIEEATTLACYTSVNYVKAVISSWRYLGNLTGFTKTPQGRKILQVID